MNFTKVQGAGNDFVLIEADNLEKDWANITRMVCDRHFSVGGDGLLVVMPSRKADIRMRIFNLDGSEADACGNGLRCVVRYAIERGLVKSGVGQLTVETMAGVRQVRLGHGKKPVIQVFMGKPAFEAKSIPMTIPQNNGLKPITDYPVKVGDREVRLNCVSMGNPHAVFFIREKPADFPLLQIGPAVEKNRLFPKAVNFEVAHVLDRKHIEARVWERGVGETLACGSGACAISVMAWLRGVIDDKVDITLPGGILNVEWDGAGEVLLSGPAEIVFTGTWPD